LQKLFLSDRPRHRCGVVCDLVRVFCTTESDRDSRSPNCPIEYELGGCGAGVLRKWIGVNPESLGFSATAVRGISEMSGGCLWDQIDEVAASCQPTPLSSAANRPAPKFPVRDTTAIARSRFLVSGCCREADRHRSEAPNETRLTGAE